MGDILIFPTGPHTPKPELEWQEIPQGLTAVLPTGSLIIKTYKDGVGLAFLPWVDPVPIAACPDVQSAMEIAEQWVADTSENS